MFNQPSTLPWEPIRLQSVAIRLPWFEKKQIIYHVSSSSFSLVFLIIFNCICCLYGHHRLQQQQSLPHVNKKNGLPVFSFQPQFNNSVQRRRHLSYGSSREEVQEYRHLCEHVESPHLPVIENGFSNFPPRNKTLLRHDCWQHFKMCSAQFKLTFWSICLLDSSPIIITYHLITN